MYNINNYFIHQLQSHLKTHFVGFFLLFSPFLPACSTNSISLKTRCFFVLLSHHHQFACVAAAAAATTKQTNDLRMVLLLHPHLLVVSLVRSFGWLGPRATNRISIRRGRRAASRLFLSTPSSIITLHCRCRRRHRRLAMMMSSQVNSIYLPTTFIPI